MGMPLDVLLVSRPVSYGVAVCVRHLTEAAIAAGHHVTVACPGPGKGPLAGWIQRAGARHVSLEMARLPALRDLLDLWSIRRLARGRDVIHLHSSKAAVLGRIAALLLWGRRPAVVVTPHYWPWLVGGKLAGLYRWIDRVLAPHCDAIVAVSERSADEGRAALGKVRHIRVIHNGVDHVRFRPDGPRADRAPGAPLVVCVGRLSEQKGQDLAIRALARLPDPAVRLRLVGGEGARGERQRLAALAALVGVAERIEWRGEVGDVAPELRAADVVVAPSRWEGMSLVFLEAMACGAALVVTDVSGSEVVRGAGLIVPREDPVALGEALERLLGDAALRRRLGRAASARSQAYDLASTLRRNLDLWSDLAPDLRHAKPRVAPLTTV